MFSIVITEKGGAQRQLDFEGPEIGIGRLEDNDICLPKNNVSKHHARLVFKDDRFVLLDQKSTNGTYVNGRRISAPMVVKRGDKIYIGDFILTLMTPESLGDGRLSRVPAPYIEGHAPRFSPGLKLDDDDEPQTQSFDSLDDRASQLPPPVAVTDRAPRARIESDAGRQLPEPPKSSSLRPPPVPREAVDPATRARSTPPPNATVVAPMPTGLKSDRPPASAAKANDRLPPSTAGNVVAPIVREKPPKVAPLKSIPPWSSDEANLQNGLTSPAVLAPSLRLQGALSSLMERLASKMNVSAPAESAFPSEHQPTLERLMDELASEGAIGADLDRRFLRETAISEAVGLGPLDRLLANRAVREVVIDGPARILADLGGGLSPVSSFFSGQDAVLVVAQRLMHRAGRTLDPRAPVQEAQLPGGGLLQLLLPPLSPKGPLISVRCPPRGQSSAESMITDGLLSTDMLAVLRTAIQKRQNVLVLGPQGAGVSTLLGVLSTLAPDHERVVILEDQPSLSLLLGHSLPLSRRAVPDLDLAALLKLASRLRYDRLVIDDVLAKDSLPALTTAASASGVLLGLHAPDPSAALTQLELFAELTLGSGGSSQGAKSSYADLLSRAIQLIVHIGTGKDGSRRIQSLSELRAATGKKADALELRTLFRYDAGSFKATEHRASFLG